MSPDAECTAKIGINMHKYTINLGPMGSFRQKAITLERRKLTRAHRLV